MLFITSYMVQMTSANSLKIYIYLFLQSFFAVYRLITLIFLQIRKEKCVFVTYADNTFGHNIQCIKKMYF